MKVLPVEEGVAVSKGMSPASTTIESPNHAPIIASGGVPYVAAKTPWPVTLGSHRVIARVETGGDAVWAHLPWRRRDLNPERKDIIVIDRATGRTIRNRFSLNLRQESGDVVFQPATAPGEYEVYYLPFNQCPHW